MKTFRICNYQTVLPGIKEKVRLAVLSDLHGILYGAGNERLLEALRSEKPDAVLSAGDMSVNYDRSTYRSAAELLRKIAGDFPVFYAYGNHETRMRSAEPAFMERYEDALKKQGVILLRNERKKICLRSTPFVFYGLEIPLEYYKKPFAPQLSLKGMTKLLGTPEKEGVQVLLAHNPRCAEAYFQWGADLIFSGHYHGGAVRLSRHHGLVSPQFRLFPSYCCGDFHRGDRHMYVSAGLGEHTIPVRVHNKRELLMVEISAGEINGTKNESR